MLYLQSFTFPNECEEVRFLYPDDKTRVSGPFRDFRVQSHKGSLYPFGILERNRLGRVSFERITIFCGGNGSGKTTALNVIAEKLGLKRDSMFNSGRFFQEYLDLCKFDADLGTDRYVRKKLGKDVALYLPNDSRIIVSDDVFAHSMKQRRINDHIHGGRADAEKDYNDLIMSGANLRSLEDYERWKARNEALRNKSAFMQKQLGSEVPEQSNGETAMVYFLQRMENPGLYLLDEPENSLSLENQIKLVEYIESSAHWFNCQFIIATHSPIFLSMKGARIYDFDENPVKTKNWTNVENVKTLYNFFKTHEAEFNKGV